MIKTIKNVQKIEKKEEIGKKMEKMKDRPIECRCRIKFNNLKCEYRGYTPKEVEQDEKNHLNAINSGKKGSQARMYEVVENQQDECDECVNYEYLDPDNESEIEENAKYVSSKEENRTEDLLLTAEHTEVSQELQTITIMQGSKSALIEHSNEKTEELKRIQNENQHLINSLAVEKEKNKDYVAEITLIKQEKNRIESELAILQKNYQTILEENRKLADDNKIIENIKVQMSNEMIGIKNELLNRDAEAKMFEKKLIDRETEEQYVCEIAMKYLSCLGKTDLVG